MLNVLPLAQWSSLFFLQFPNMAVLQCDACNRIDITSTSSFIAYLSLENIFPRIPFSMRFASWIPSAGSLSNNFWKSSLNHCRPTQVHCHNLTNIEHLYKTFRQYLAILTISDNLTNCVTQLNYPPNRTTMSLEKCVLNM